MSQRIKDFILDILFPAFCLGCGLEGTYLCDDCKAILEISEHQYCLCEKSALRIPLSEKKGKCQRCQNKKLSGIFFALSYKEKHLTRKLIHFFKYGPYYLKDLAKSLSLLIIDHISLLGKNQKALFENSILIPVPMEKKKLKKRGYNQSKELAKELAKKIEVPLVLNNLIKIKITLSQMELPEKKRKENLKDAFSCQNPEQIKNKKIFLIDDVYTTGSTMEECSKILRHAGAKEVWGIVVARD
ncbi:hypothetical protein KJ786_01330 [Patescibacteria group bacterium]|nr:hypothetical protein [Patescibacteria group bacterium]